MKENYYQEALNYIKNWNGVDIPQINKKRELAYGILQSLIDEKTQNRTWYTNFLRSKKFK